MYSFEVYKDRKDEFRFRFRAANGEIMFSSEGYKSKASALKSIESIRKNVADAELQDLTIAPKEAPEMAKPAAKAKAPAVAPRAKKAAKAEA